MIRTLSAVAIVAAALSSSAFAQEEAAPKKPAHALRHYRGSYNQVQEPAFAAPRASVNGAYFDRSFDRSRIGDHDADFNPPS